MTDLATHATDDLIEDVVIYGNLAKLQPAQRASYYAKVCESLGLNPYTRPFAYIEVQGKTILYALKDATDQLRAKRGVSLQITSREVVDDLYIVTARATLPDGRTDEEIGAVSIGGLKGEALANAYMKAGTKAKRRVTLSICGLGMLDETETETIPGARYGDSALDGPRPLPISPRRQAIAAQMDEALAEADALLAEPLPAEKDRRGPAAAESGWTEIDGKPFAGPVAPEETGELPGPRWASTPLGREVSAIADALLSLPADNPARRFVLPANNAADDEVRQWVVSKRRLLRASEPAR